MRFGNFELHNIAELLEGDGRAVMPDFGDGNAAGAHATDAAWNAEDGEGRWITRIPNEVRMRLNVSARKNALQATGAEIRFNHGSGPVRLTIKTAQAPSLIEIYNGDFARSWQVVGTDATTFEITPPANIDDLARVARDRGLPFDARLCRVLLPWRPPCRIIALEGDVSPPRAEQLPRRRLLAYGSSITHGNMTLRPSGMWAFRLAQRLGIDLVNLGFGGGAHLESAIADHIAARQDWDLMTAELGINLVNGIGAAEFARRVDDFLGRIVSALRGRSLFVIDMFAYYHDFAADRGASREFRTVVADAVRRIDLPNVRHVSGLDLLSRPEHLSADLLHPAPAGMEEIAAKLAGIIGGAEIQL